MDRGPLLAPALVLLLAGASAAVLVRDDIAVTPAATDPPVTLSSGTSGSITLGQSLTSASVSHALGVGQATVTTLHGGTQDWRARVELQSATGIGGLDSFTIAVCRSGCNNQIVVSTGTITQTTGTARTIPAGTTDGFIGISGTKASLGDTVFTTQIVLTPASGDQPQVRYDYTITVRRL